ncbi:MAG: LPS export ABC transporter periplasmic protein LptC [Deltaproteobacteria bacterium]|nr:LPS export ABC transporter periplasmic protein LptC [Deltaproteobacteria bacterium]
MSREQLRFVLALTVTASLLVVGYYVMSSLRAQKANDEEIRRLTQDVAPEAEQRMQNFRRAKIRDGRKVWEIAARQARYSQEHGEIVVEGPEVSLYPKDGEVISLRCQEGRVRLDGDEEVTHMELSGEIEVRLNGFVITTASAVYDSELHTISSSGSVRVVGNGIEVEGQGYTMDVAAKRLTLAANVRTTVMKREG